MIFFIPDRFVPRKITGNKRKYWNELVSMLLLFCAAFICSWVKDAPENGLMPESLPDNIQQWWENTRKILHALPCPLCGGTRSFMLMCRGNLTAAAHYSFFGIYFFLAVIINIPLKWWLLKRDEQTLPPRIVGIIRFFDNSWLLVAIACVMMGIQILLHCTGIFRWYVL